MCSLNRCRIKRLSVLLMTESHTALALYFDQGISKSIVIINTSILTHRTDRLRGNILMPRPGNSYHPEPVVSHPTFSKWKWLLNGQYHTTQLPTAISKVCVRSTELFMCTDESAATTTHVQLSTRGLLNENKLWNTLLENQTPVLQKLYPLSLF